MEASVQLTRQCSPAGAAAVLRTNESTVHGTAEWRRAKGFGTRSVF